MVESHNFLGLFMSEYNQEPVPMYDSVYLAYLSFFTENCYSLRFKNS